MPRAKRAELLRHERDEDPGFEALPERESGFIATAPAKPRREGKGKRSLEDMMASQPNNVAMSMYALERIAGLEDQIEKILSLCTTEARALVVKQRPSLTRYLPAEPEPEPEEP